jgi:hypothetical protein
MTAEEAFPIIKELITKKLEEQAEPICGFSHEYFRRHFGLSDEEIQAVPGICFDDETFICEDYLRDLRFHRYPSVF